MSRRFADAVWHCDQAIEADPKIVHSYVNKGKALYELGEFIRAIICHDEALSIDKGSADAWEAKGDAMRALNDFDSAILCFRQTLAIQPTPNLYIKLGMTYEAAQQSSSAIDCFNESVRLAPTFEVAYALRGASLINAHKFPEAAESYEMAFHLNPQLHLVAGFRLFLKRQICTWDNIEAVTEDLTQRLRRHERAAPMQAVSTLLTDSALQRMAAEDFINVIRVQEDYVFPRSNPPGNRKIRIGYFSADFYNHATAHLIAELLELHDKAQFEVIAFSFGPNQPDEMRTRLSMAFSEFIDVRGMSDTLLVELARSRHIDIAVDLKGFTQGNRLNIFQRRVAPVQVNYLGYPGTLGAHFMDYIVADNTIIPEALQPSYSEKIAYMPDSYQPNDRKRVIDPMVVNRTDVGLPESGFVYCCFNNAYKITPRIFDSWMEILKTVEDSVLWMLDENDEATQNLRKEAQLRGVAPSRLVFSPRVESSKHLARHRLADLCLDTHPCNAHTTASDALWSGTPILTMPGETFASRVAASLLTAMAMPELIVTSTVDYIRVAQDLANNSTRLSAMRTQIEKNKRSAPLFDTPRYTRNLENLYLQMHARRVANLPPAHLKRQTTSTTVA